MNLAPDRKRSDIPAVSFGRAAFARALISPVPYRDGQHIDA